MTGPLASLKILDFSTLLPGPFASMFLADLGADVVRIEAPGRTDMTRLMPPFDGRTSAWHGLLNRSKRSLGLDLKRPGAAEIVKRLVQTYDIVLEQFRPGVMDRLGVGYAALRAANPRVIYCALTGYGQTGPYRHRAGHDNNYLALSGIMSHTGRKEDGPLPPGVQVADIGAGSYNVLVGILAAEIHRRETEEGQLVDVSMFDGALAWNAPAASNYFVGGFDPAYEEQRLNGGSFYDYYATADGRYLSVGSLEPKFWTGFCHAIGRPDLVEAGMSLDLDEQRAVKAEIQKVIKSRTLAEWTAVFEELDVCVEPVLHTSEAAEHPQTQAREMIVEVPKPDGSTQKQTGHPIKFSRCAADYKHVGAPLGTHTRDVLSEAGYAQDEIEALYTAGVVS